MIPINSFIFTKQADYHYNKFIESNYTNKAELEKAYKLYNSGTHKFSYHNYKQMLKINLYKNSENINEWVEYINELFPDKHKEIEKILNSNNL